MKTFSLRLMLTVLGLVLALGNVWGQTAYFEKVTSQLSDWSGDYLIVYESEKIAFDGSLSTLDAVSNIENVTISDNKIEATDEMKAIMFTVAKKSVDPNVYSLKSASGYYISGTTVSAKASNGLKQASTANDYEITFGFESGSPIIYSKSSDQNMILRYNSAKDQNRFRFYKSGQQAISLYRLVDNSIPSIESESTLNLSSSSIDGTFNVTWTGMEDVDVYLFSDESCTSSFSDSWFQADIDTDKNVYYIVDENTQTSPRTVYMQLYGLDSESNVYTKVVTVTQAGAIVKYAITIDGSIENGSVSSSVTEAAAGDEVTLSATPFAGYIFSAWDVKDASDNVVTVTDNTFTMPASNVTVSATFEVRMTKDLTIDFEKTKDNYPDWTFTNITPLATNTGVIPHGGSNFGKTEGTTTASIVTKNKIEKPESIVFYVSKQSTNTTASSWKVQVSSNGTSWTDLKTQSASSMSLGEWVEVKQDLSSYPDVYVRIYYDGSQAIRCIDDVTLSYFASTDPSIVADDNVNIEAEATSGEFGYEIVNPNGSSLSVTEKEDVDWISDVTVDDVNSKITFITTANTGEERSAIITLTYGDDLATKDVTITQSKYVASYVVTIITPDNGTLVVKDGENVVNDGDEVKDGTVLMIEATPADGYKYKNWQYKEEGGEWISKWTNYDYTINGKSVSLRATFEELPRYTVTFSVNGEETDVREETTGAGVTPPSVEDIAEYKFAGWSTTEVPNVTTGKQTFVTLSEGKYMPTDDTVLYAIYSHSEEGEGGTVDGEYFIYADVEGTKYYMEDMPEKSVTTINQITSTTDVNNAFRFTITKKEDSEDQYSISFDANGTTKYLCCVRTGSSSNYSYYLQAQDSPYYFTFSAGAKDGTTRMLSTFANRALAFRTTVTPKVFKIYSTTNLTEASTEYYDLIWEPATGGQTTYYTSALDILTVGAPKYTTYYSHLRATKVPNGMVGYIAYYDEDNVWHFEAKYGEGTGKKVIPAGEAVVLGAATGKYALVYVADDDTNDEPLNQLEGTDVDTDLVADETCYFYALTLNKSKDPESVGFYWMNADGSAFTNKAHKAYLKVKKDRFGSSAQNVKGFMFCDVENGTTSIFNVTTKTDANGAKYNLSGQRVNANYKGIVIMNGKKIVNK